MRYGRRARLKELRTKAAEERIEQFRPEAAQPPADPERRHRRLDGREQRLDWSRELAARVV